MPYSSTQPSEDYFHENHKTLLPQSWPHAFPPVHYTAQHPSSAIPVLDRSSSQTCHDKWHNNFQKQPWQASLPPSQHCTPAQWTASGLCCGDITFTERSRWDFQAYFSLVMGQKLGLGSVAEKMHTCWSSYLPSPFTNYFIKILFKLLKKESLSAI